MVHFVLRFQAVCTVSLDFKVNAPSEIIPLDSLHARLLRYRMCMYKVIKPFFNGTIQNTTMTKMSCCLFKLSLLPQDCILVQF